jgi:hypothetical protein
MIKEKVATHSSLLCQDPIFPTLAPIVGPNDNNKKLLHQTMTTSILNLGSNAFSHVVCKPLSLAGTQIIGSHMPIFGASGYR